MEETDNVELLPTVDGVYVDNVVETLEIPDIKNPEDKEQENIETEQEGGL